ncbi:MAG TPA: hypothetical protein VMS64_21710 [Candidatus Methylomirabilis sp.]|nr:hypothetical protein [Candidatus Methylomirabilis sp.]
MRSPFLLVRRPENLIYLRRNIKRSNGRPFATPLGLLGGTTLQKGFYAFVFDQKAWMA